jgi:hypothetical protein
MHRILLLPDIWPAGYPANPKAGYPVRAGYRISGLILGLTTIFLENIKSVYKNSVNSYKLLQTLNKA